MSAPAPGKSPLTICLFGTFGVWLNGAPVPDLDSCTGHWLLAWLILRHPAEVECDRLAEALWPQSAESARLKNFRTALDDLRRALGAQKSRLYSPTPQTLSIDLHSAEVDVLAFDAAIAQGDLASLAHAVALYRGPLLERCAEPWALPDRLKRQQDCVRALEALAQGALGLGSLAAAERYLRQAVAIDPLRDSSHRALMSVLAREGNHSTAIQVYHDLQQRLHDETGADPEPETQALFDQVKAKVRPKAGEIRPASDTSALWLGPTERLPAATARVTETEAFDHNLPLQLSRFVGREDQIAEVHQLLSSHRLVTLTGAGGCGKTRLALKVAADLLDECGDGVWFVDLAPLEDPALVPQAVAAALALHEEPGRSVAQTLVDHLRQRQLQLVLDNCEHVLADCARLVETLLQACPSLRILATSREALRIPGEQPYRVPSLSLPEMGWGRSSGREESRSGLARAQVPTLELLEQYEAVRLFVDRAAAASPSFALTPENAAAVIEICRRLDGIPLAIELAAARINLMPIEKIQTLLDDRFRLLTLGSRTALPRQQTLRGLIHWSWALLAERERVLLRRVSVFAGGFTWEAAEAVCPGDGIESADLLETLASLVDKSLLIPDTRGEGRYGLLETIREYGRERLRESDEEERLQERHARYFLSVTQQRDGEEPPWLDRLEREHDNLRAAMGWMLAHGDPEELFRMGTAMARLWNQRGYWSEGRERLTEMLALALPPEARAMLLRLAGQLAWLQADYPAAEAVLAESVVIYRERGNTEDLPAPLNALGEVARTQGDYSTARAYFEESRAILQARGDKANLAWALQALGEVAQECGDPGAQTLVRESLALFQEVKDQRGIASALSDLGEMARQDGDLRTARTLQEQSRGIGEQLDHKRTIARCLERLGELAAREGDYKAAASFHRQCLAIRRKIGDRGRIATCLERLAGLAASSPTVPQPDQTAANPGEADGEEKIGVCYERAARLFGAAEALRERLGVPLSPVERPGYECVVALLRDRLTASTFAAAWTEGGTMPLEQAMDAASCTA